MCVLSPSPRAPRRAPGRLLPLPRPPPPFPGWITFPGLRSGSGGCLQRPASRRSIAERPQPAGGARGAAGGAGGPEPSTSEVPPRAGAGGRGARGRRGCGAGGRKDKSSLDPGRERARGRGGRARARRAGGSGAVTGTATGVKGAQLQEAGRPRRRSVRAPRRDPAPPRAPPSAPAQSNPRRRPGASRLLEEAEGTEGEAGSRLALPGQTGGKKLSCKFIMRSVIGVKMIGGRGGVQWNPRSNKGSFPSKRASFAKRAPRPPTHRPARRYLESWRSYRAQSSRLGPGERPGALRSDQRRRPRVSSHRLSSGSLLLFLKPFNSPDIHMHAHAPFSLRCCSWERKGQPS